MGTVNAAPRRTQRDRSQASQRALLEATVTALDEVGYANLSLTEVSRRAGLSVGAHRHHFRTKAALVAAAVDHVAQRRIAQMRRELGENRWRGVEGCLDLAWHMYSGPLFRASIELWTAARTDPELRELVLAVEDDVDREVVRVGLELLGEAASRDEVANGLRVSMAAMRGLIMRAQLRPQSELRDEWAAYRTTLLNLLDPAAAK